MRHNRERSHRPWVPLLTPRSRARTQPRAVPSGIAAGAVIEGGHQVGQAEIGDLDGIVRELRRGSDRVAVVAYDRPQAEEIARLGAMLDLHPLLIEDLQHAGQRSKIERYDDTLFIVLRSVRYDDPTEDVTVNELHVVMQGPWVVIIRQGDPGAAAWTPEHVRQDPAVLSHGAEGVLYTVIDSVIDTYFPVLRGVENDLEQIESQVFAGDTAAPERIYRLGREVIDLQRSIIPIGDVVAELITGFERYGTAEGLQAYLRDVADHVARITGRVTEIRELLTQILTVNSTLVGQRQNEDMKKISSWAAILFAPTLIGAIYGMNFTDMPELHWAFGYPLALGAMLALAVVLYIVFKKHRWM